MPENLIPLVQYKVKSDNLSLHFHEEYEILFVTGGMIEITVNNKAIIAQKGDVIFLNTYESHYTKVLKTPYKRYVLMLSPDILEKKIIDLNLLGIFKKRTADFKFCLHFNDWEIIKSFIEMIVCGAESEKISYAVEAQCRVTQAYRIENVQFKNIAFSNCPENVQKSLISSAADDDENAETVNISFGNVTYDSGR